MLLIFKTGKIKLPFVLKRYPVHKSQKIQLFLLNEAKMSMNMVQKVLAKKRVFDDKGFVVVNSQILECPYIEIATFEGKTKGLKPIFEVDDFALFDKPSGLMVHPVSRATKYTLLDEIRYHFGDEANLVHRIDAETSGLVLVSKNKKSEKILKMMFENRKYVKKYLAIIRGNISKEIKINTAISKDNKTIRVKMTTKNFIGKESLTFITPIKYNDINNTTLIEAIPRTGRQHQIRVHLDSIGHPILGDPVYGVDEKIANDYLLKNLSNQDRLKFTGAKRLMLHSNNISFIYKNIQYDICSKQSINEML